MLLIDHGARHYVSYAQLNIPTFWLCYSDTS